MPSRHLKHSVDQNICANEVVWKSQACSKRSVKYRKSFGNVNVRERTADDNFGHLEINEYFSENGRDQRRTFALFPHKIQCVFFF